MRNKKLLNLINKSVTATGTIFSFSRSKKWITIIPILIGLSTLISNGPNLQNYIVKLIVSEAPTIYDAINNDLYVSFPNLSHWLLGSLNPIFILTATAAIIVSFRSKHPKEIFLYSSTTLFVCLTIIDVFIALINKSITLEFAYTNFLSNLIGSVLVGAFFVLTLVAINDSLDIFELASHKLRQYIGSLMFLTTAAFVSTTIYFTAKILLNPTDVEVFLTVNHPGTGQIHLNLEEGPNKNALKNGHFGLIPQNARVKKIYSDYWGEPLSLQWERTSDKLRYDISLKLNKGCHNNSEFPPGGKNLVFEDVDYFSISIDGRGSKFTTLDGAKNNYFVNNKPSEGTLFFTEKDKKTDLLDVQEFAEREVEIFSSSETFKVFVSALKPFEEQTIPSKAVKIKVNDKLYKINFTGPLPPFESKILCQNIDLGNYELSANTEINEESFIIGATVEIKNKSNTNPIYSKAYSRINLFQKQSELKYVNIAPISLITAEPKKVSSVIVYGKSAEVEVNGKPIQSPDHQTFIAFGNLDAYLNDEHLKIGGTAWLLQNNSRRLNPTRWEKLDLKIKLFFSGLAIGFVTFLGKAFMTVLRENREISWVK